MSVGTAKSGVPMKTMRSAISDPVLALAFLLARRLGELFHDQIALQLGNVIDEQDAVQVIDLVLDAGREQTVDLALLLLAIIVEVSHANLRGPFHLGVVFRN